MLGVTSLCPVLKALKIQSISEKLKKKSREGLFQKSLEHSHLDSHFPSILKKSTGKTEHHSFRNLSIHPDTCGIQQRHS